MGHRDPTYVIFDGDNDRWAYSYMRGWNKLDQVDFDFRDAHDLTPMTSRAQDEAYVKSQLRERMKQSGQAIVLIGESTKHLRKFVPWEIDLALERDLPIVCVHIDEKLGISMDRCPIAIRDQCAAHVIFKMKIIKHALDSWPTEYRRLSAADKAKGPRFYSQDFYRSLGL